MKNEIILDFNSALASQFQTVDSLEDEQRAIEAQIKEAKAMGRKDKYPGLLRDLKGNRESLEPIEFLIRTTKHNRRIKMIGIDYGAKNLEEFVIKIEKHLEKHEKSMDNWSDVKDALRDMYGIESDSYGESTELSIGAVSNDAAEIEAAESELEEMGILNESTTDSEHRGQNQETRNVDFENQ